MKIRNNLGNIYSTTNSSKKNNTPTNKIGRVVHIVSSERSAGYRDTSDIGSVYVIDHLAPKPNINLSGDTPLSNSELEKAGLKKVFPFYPQFTYVPLIDELVLLLDLPSFDSDQTKGKNVTYYLNTIDLYLNSHHNSQGVYNIINENGDIKLGEYAKESNTVPNLIPLEGDFIINSRWGSGIRFSSTFDIGNPLPVNNPWKLGETGSPITMIVNGYNRPINQITPYIENINNDDSSIYLTSTQYLSLDTFSPNVVISEKPFFPLLEDSDSYGGLNKSQIIISSNRISLNSSKDDIVLYASTNIEMGANNTVHLNGKENLYLNSPNVYLGTINNNNLKNVEPVLLGYKSKELINELLSLLIDFTEDLKIVSATDPRYLGMSISTFSSNANQKLQNLVNKKINNILSKTTFTS